MVKDSLHMSFTLDESSTRRLQNEITAGIALIREYGQSDADFAPGTIPAAWLCAYCLRAESGAAETFMQDYGAELRSWKSRHEADEFAAAMGYDS